jgi:hypothetical protein
MMRDSIERVRTSLQIEEGIDLHITSWIVQRIGWGLMFGLLLAAALGFFGNGILSETSVSVDGASLSYERFCRYENSTALEIEAPDRSGSLIVRFNPEFSNVFKVEQINPEPSGQKILDGNRVDIFHVHGRGHITYYLSARTQGSTNYEMLVNGTMFRLAQYVYP